MEVAMASTQVNLYEAKTHLSSLVDRAAKGEEFVIAKGGKPKAKLSAVSVEDRAAEPLPWGQNLLGLSKLPESFYEDIPLEYFVGDEKDPIHEVLR
jgi:prevent-host-death family protein